MKRRAHSDLLAGPARGLTPVTAQISLTGRCNENCVHCLVPRGRGREMSSVRVRSVIRELRALNCFQVTLTGGEPMMRRDFFDLALCAGRAGLGVKVLTNGTFIDDRAIRRLRKASIITVQVSLYGVTAKTHDGVTRLEGSFERTMRAIRLLESSGIPLEISTVVMKQNFREIVALRRMARRRRLKILFDFIVRPMHDGAAKPLKNRISDSQLKVAVKEGLLPFFTAAGFRLKQKEDQLCVKNIGKSHLYISHDGYIYPSQHLMIRLARYREGALRDVWFRSGRLRKLRDLRLDDFECSRCELCFNCCWEPGMAMLEHGSMYERPKEFCRLMKVSGPWTSR